MALLERNSKSALYKGLSSFWLKHFKDSDQLNSIYAGAESLFGQTYLDLMEIILSKSLTNIPVFKKEDWEMLVLQEDLVSFDPAIASSDSLIVGPVTFNVFADKVDPLLDDVYISFVDVSHVREADKEFLPTVGSYNHALSGKSLNVNNWTVVVPSNTTIKKAMAIAKTRLISNQAIAALDVGADAVFKITYNEGETEFEITITAAEQSTLVTPDDLAALIELKIAHPNILVTIQAGYLLIDSIGNTLRITESNTKAEELVFFKAFNFLVSVDVPLDLEEILAWDYTYYLQTITEGYSVAGIEYRYPLDAANIAKKIRRTSYIMNTIYDPSLVLEEQRDYRIDGSFVYFKSDPFALTNVAFRVIGTTKQLAFWMSDVLYDNTLLYDRYGYRFTDPRDASEDYKLFLRGIIFYFTNGPDIDSITSALNLVAGIPVVLENNEVVTAVTPLLVTTNKNSYEVPPAANPIVVVDQIVNAFEVLTDAFEVVDYIIDPNWFANLSVPSTLMPGATIEQRQLKETVQVPLVGDGSYIIGNLDPSGVTLTTDVITPYGAGLVDYQLATDAFFVVEIPDVSVVIPVLVPKEYTDNATTLVELASVITKATNQVSGVAFTGSTLDEDAVFTINGDIITILEGTYPSITAIIILINAQITSTIEARLNPLGEKILFLSPDGDFISIYDSSATAQIILGIQGVKSFQGIVATALDDTLVFSNVSSASDSLFRIVNITNSTMAAWSMKPFRPGSGEIVGEDGQPNLTYQIYDDILKYSTFKVSFNIASLTEETDLNALIDIVLKGKPSYVTPIVSPIVEFEDTLEHNPIIIPVSDIPTFTPVDDTISEYYDSEVNEAVDIVFNTLDKIMVHYDDNFQVADFIQLDEPGANVFFNADESIFRFDSKDQQVVHRTFHTITIGVQNNLDPEEEALFSFPGIYNYGVQTQGEKYPLTTLERINPGAHNIGVYTANLDWVRGIYKSEIDPRATHMFLMDTTRPDLLQDLGFGTGDFLELKFWPDAGNNGKFTILNVSYNVETPYGLADILWFQNPDGLADNIPLGKDEFDGSRYAFSYKSGNVGKRWFITFPESLAMSDLITELDAAVGDNREVFPFDISLIGPDVVWGTTAYTQFFTRQDLREEKAFLGERHQLSAEWYRCIYIGEIYTNPITGVTGIPLINPLNKLICETSEFQDADATMIGFDLGNNIIGNTIKINNQTMYNGGEFSTEDVMVATLGDFVASPIPGYVEYLP